MPSSHSGSRTLGDDLAELLGSPRFSDVQLRVRDGQFHLHKSILYVRCPAMQEIIDADPTASVIEFPALSAVQAKFVLEFIYADQVVLDVESAPVAFEAARTCKLSGLADVSVERMCESLCLDSLSGCVRIAHEHSVPRLLSACTRWVANLPEDIRSGAQKYKDFTGERGLEGLAQLLNTQDSSENVSRTLAHCALLAILAIAQHSPCACKMVVAAIRPIRKSISILLADSDDTMRTDAAKLVAVTCAEDRDTAEKLCGHGGFDALMDSLQCNSEVALVASSACAICSILGAVQANAVMLEQVLQQLSGSGCIEVVVDLLVMSSSLCLEDSDQLSRGLLGMLQQIVLNDAGAFRSACGGERVHQLSQLLQERRVLSAISSFLDSRDSEVKRAAGRVLGWISHTCVPGLVRTIQRAQGAGAEQLDAARALSMLCCDVSCFDAISDSGGVAALGSILGASEPLMEVCMGALAKLAHIRAAMDEMFECDILAVVSAVLSTKNDFGSKGSVQKDALQIAIHAVQFDERYSEAVCTSTTLPELTQLLLATRDRSTVASTLSCFSKNALAGALASLQSSTDVIEGGQGVFASQTGQLGGKGTESRASTSSAPSGEQPQHEPSAGQSMMVAAYSFRMGPEDEDQLCDERLLEFDEGELLTRMVGGQDGWWLARNAAGEVGFVPPAYMVLIQSAARSTQLEIDTRRHAEWIDNVSLDAGNLGQPGEDGTPRAATPMYSNMSTPLGLAGVEGLKSPAVFSLNEQEHGTPRRHSLDGLSSQSCTPRETIDSGVNSGRSTPMGFLEGVAHRQSFDSGVRGSDAAKLHIDQTDQTEPNIEANNVRQCASLSLE